MSNPRLEPVPASIAHEQIDRVVIGSKEAELGAMAAMLYSVPDASDKVDAVAVLPGLGEHWRISSAVRNWDSSPVARNLLVTGVFDGEETFRPTALEDLQRPPFNMVRTNGVQIQPTARHTRTQTDWLAERVADNGNTSLALHVSPYHLLRGYVTALRSFEREQVGPIPIIPVPVRIPPSMITPETGINGWEMFNGEAARISQYQQKGDVATYDQLRDYLDWLWEQPIITGENPQSPK